MLRKCSSAGLSCGVRKACAHRLLRMRQKCSLAGPLQTGGRPGPWPAEHKQGYHFMLCVCSTAGEHCSPGQPQQTWGASFHFLMLRMRAPGGPTQMQSVRRPGQPQRGCGFQRR